MKQVFTGLLAAGMATCAVLANPASSQADALGDTCELLKFMAVGDMQGARSYWDGMTTHWSDTDRERGTANIFVPLQNLELQGLKVFTILELPGVAHEYLAISFFNNGRPLYFRVFFENWEGQMRLVNFRYQQDYEKISAPPFVQVPAEISCP